jgi:hypothetical protein
MRIPELTLRHSCGFADLCLGDNTAIKYFADLCLGDNTAIKY